MKIHHINTFIGPNLQGNPTAVVISNTDLKPDSMHHIAEDSNIPVTAFLQQSNSNLPHQIRYFTSTGEIPACGHATLAAAGLVFKQQHSTSESFQTITGLQIKTSRANDTIFMEYPKYDAQVADINKDTLKALGIESFTDSFFCHQLETIFIELADAALLRSLNPDFKALLQSSDSFKEVVVMAISDNPSFDFQLRSFCPWIGIDEDPVTGSVHSFLAPHWADRLKKNKLVAWQTSLLGGEVHLVVTKDAIQIGGRILFIE